MNVLTGGVIKFIVLKKGTPILYLPDDGWYTIADLSDIDGEPCSRLKADKIKIVEKFSD